MKNLNSLGIKLFILTAIAGLFLASQLKSPSANERGFSNTSTASVPDSQFIIGAFDNGNDTALFRQRNEMKINTWHFYTSPTTRGWLNHPYDRYDTSYSLYEGIVTGVVDENNQQRAMRTLMDEPIIEYLVGGQRIDYQCEYIQPSFSADRYWYYAYDSSMNNSTTVYDTVDNSRYGEGEKVKKCKRTDETALNGFVAIDFGLRANREMSFNQTNQWMRDDEYEWYVLPKIRIDSAYAADYSHINDTICKIIVTGWKGNVEAEFDLSVLNFKQTQYSNYSGNYMESFYKNGQSYLSYFTIDKSKLPNFTNTTSIFNWDNICKCDIKIYWSGKCDMWIDRVRIENKPAHQYLTLKEYRWIEKVSKEIEWSGRNYSSGNPIPNYIYFEECQMSHFPMIRKLNKQITDSSGGKNELVVFLNYDLFTAHIPKDWQYPVNSNLMKQFLYDDYGLRTIVMGSYALEGFALSEPVDDHRSSYHPNTLSNSEYNRDIGILSEPLSPAEYDLWLQEHFDDNGYPWGVNWSAMMKLIYDLSKNGMRIINGAQAHLWFMPGHKLKEPSNEELELQANLALTNNVKGLIWFPYVGENKTFDSATYNKGNCNLM